MATRTVLVSLVILAAPLARPSAIDAQTTDGPTPVSIERIRAGLEHTPLLRLDAAGSDSPPTFHVEVRAPYFVAQLPQEKPFDPTFGLPSVPELLIDGVQKIRAAKRGHAERRARQQVDSALAAFCAAHDCSMSQTPR